MTPRIHPREPIVGEATTALRRALNDWAIQYGEDLTYPEELRAVADVFGSHLSAMAKFGIRAERHPTDPDKPGGWE